MVGRAYGFRMESDDDFRSHGGNGDLENFYRRCDVLDCTMDQTATLPRRAIERAREICDEYSDAIDEVADVLYVHRAIGHDAVIAAIQRTPCADRLLSRARPHDDRIYYRPCTIRRAR